MHGTAKPARIAIDGPAGAGKSTIGEKLAHTLGYIYVDTGATYRAVAWLALHEGTDIHDGTVLAQLAQQSDILIERPSVDDGRQYTVLIAGNDVTWELRSPEVTRYVSTVATKPEVRAVLRQWQRAMAQKGQVVMVGRDIGSVVLPDAELKIYLTAGTEERARRRYAELMGRSGNDMSTLPTLEEIIKDIARRDDEDRENMRPAQDAIVVDTDGSSVSQVLDTILGYVEHRDYQDFANKTNRTVHTNYREHMEHTS